MDAFDDRLYRTAWLITYNHAVAEDAVQETFIRGWRHIASFRQGSNLGAWLTRILINHLINERRRRRVPQVQMNETFDLGDPNASADRQLLHQETEANLWDGLGRLPADQRTAIVLRFFDDYSLQEICDATGWRLGTVKSRLHRALANLRASMTAADVTEHGFAGKA